MNDSNLYRSVTTEYRCPNCGVSHRRALAEKILLELIRLSQPTHTTETHFAQPGQGVDLAWSIADAFLSRETRNDP